MVQNPKYWRAKECARLQNKTLLTRKVWFFFVYISHWSLVTFFCSPIFWILRGILYDVTSSCKGPVFSWPKGKEPWILHCGWILLLLITIYRSRTYLSASFTPWKKERKKRGPITCRTDRANEANKMFIIWLCRLFQERNEIIWRFDRWSRTRGPKLTNRSTRNQSAI